jgi:acyl-CoA thioesterase-1
MSQILVFGASISHGVGDTGGGWVDRLKRQLHSDMYSGGKSVGEKHTFFNLGIPGNTAADLLTRMPSEIEARGWREEEFVIVISVGTNDSKAVDSQDNKLFTVDQYKQNLQALIDKAKDYTEKIMFVGLTPVNESMLQPKFDAHFWQARVKEFDSAMTEVAKTNKVPKVELFEDCLSADWESKLFDGLHPNTAGHKLIADMVKPQLMELLK